MNIISNFFPITFTNEHFTLSRLEYNPELLQNLRKQYNKTHSFFRNEDYIYISPMEDNATKIGDSITIDINKKEKIVLSLMKHVFFRKFRETYPDIIPLNFYPFRIFSRKKSDDLLIGLLPENLTGTLSLRKLIEIQFREITNTDAKQFGALVNVHYQWGFNKNCQELIEEGFNIIGLNVLTSEILPGLDGILAPDESLIGAVNKINENVAVVETNEGKESHQLSELYLHKSQRNIREYLEFKLGELRTEQITNTIKEKDQTRLNAKHYFNEVKDFVKYISSIKYQNKTNFEFNISPSPQRNHRKFSIQNPSFIFDYSQGAAHNKPSIGLINYGPYDSTTFDIKKPNFLVVCTKSNRGAFTEFLGKLKKGIPSSAYFKGGMIGKYRLHDISFDIVELDNYSISEYQNKITDYIKQSKSLPHLAIIETNENFKKEKADNNPYYHVKSYFLGLGVPVQGIKSENIRKPDNSLQWIIESIALQVYAKLGGKPWVLPSSSSIDNEIIVGIGSTLIRPNLLLGSAQEKIVGITTFFTGDGRYIFGNQCKDVVFEEYFDELLTSLRQSIKEVSEDYGWQEDSTIRITFHIFKPIKNVEAEVVERLLSEFPKYKIQFCFVTISDRHPFLIFDSDQEGTGASHKGGYIPERGQSWILDDFSCLLQLKGPSDIKTPKHGFSNPVLIRIHEKSTYKDLNSVTQQVFNFTNLSWRGFHPTHQPVTILYSDLIVKHLSQLKKIKTWKPEIVNSLLKFKKWFL